MQWAILLIQVQISNDLCNKTIPKEVNRQSGFHHHVNGFRFLEMIPPLVQSLSIHFLEMLQDSFFLDRLIPRLIDYEPMCYQKKVSDFHELVMMAMVSRRL